MLETPSSEVKELLPPALKRPREEEEENLPLDSDAKKAKLDYTEETLEQNINPNSISNKIDSTSNDDDENNSRRHKSREITLISGCDPESEE